MHCLWLLPEDQNFPLPSSGWTMGKALGDRISAKVLRRTLLSQLLISHLLETVLGQE